ncbi:hypothetical protein EDD11_007583 [Mortierella claussenii]|nr:hypothetical protein EDD11_007583 [Mortierella claussenii]
MPLERITVLLKVAYLDLEEHILDDYPPKTPAQIHGATIRYGALIKHLHFHCEDNTCSILFQNKILRNHTKLRDHAKLSRLYLKYYAEDPRNRYMAEEREQIVFNGIALELQRDLTWALSYENPELLRTLAIPIKDLDRYLNRVHQFKSLTTVLFLIDKRLEYGDDITLDKADLLIYEPMKLLVYRLAAERQLKMRDMVRFVEKHVSTHEGVLQYVDCPPLMLLLGQQIQTCPPDVELKMLGLLPSLADTSLDLMIESRVK